MADKKLDFLYEKLEELEKTRMNYLEADKNESARRIKRKIDNVEQEIRLYQLDKIEKELSVYRKIVSNYPSLHNQIKKELIEKGYK